MKKSLFILAAASAVAFAACNGGNNEGSYTKEQADSIAQAKIDSAQVAIKLENDSAMQAQAIRSADSIRVIDSIIAATKASSSKTTIIRSSGGGRTTTTTKTEETTVAPDATTEQKSKFDSRKVNNNTTITEQKQEEQKSKFDKRK